MVINVEGNLALRAMQKAKVIKIKMSPTMYTFVGFFVLLCLRFSSARVHSDAHGKITPEDRTDGEKFEVKDCLWCS